MIAPTPLEPAICLVPARAALGEGALWSTREKALYWVDILGRRLHRHVPATAENRSWSMDEEISAIAERHNGEGLVVTLRRGFALFDPHAPQASVLYLAQPELHLPGNRFNDGKCDAMGRFWAGTMDFDCQAPTGALYCLTPDGQCSRHEAGFPVTNGPTWSLDNRTMYFNDSVNGRVFAYDFDAEQGTISNRRVWLAFPSEDGVPDGMCTDTAGRIWIAHWGGGCVTCHDPESAKELVRIPLPVSQVTSCAFGGDDLQALFITSARVGLDQARLEREPLAGALFKVLLDCAGNPANRFGG